jgi:hypothetical protein
VLSAVFFAFERSATAATIQTVDDVTIKNATIAFDGQTLTVTSTTQPTPTTMPLEDVARIVVKEASVSAPTPPSGTRTPPSGIIRVRRTPRPNPTTNPSVAGVSPATTQPAMPSSNWRMKLTNGDALHGTIESWADQHLMFKPDAAPAAEVGIAEMSIDRLWHGDAADQAKAEAMNAARGDDDIAFVQKEKDADIVVVHGTATGIDEDELVFQYEGADRRIKLNRIIGIETAQHTSVKTDDSFHQVLRFADGEQISGQWKSMQNDVITLETDHGMQTRVPLSSVAGIDFRNGRIVYLSDLTPSRVEQTPFFDQVMPYKTDAALGGGPLKLGNQTYDKGLAVHSRCVLEYSLAGRFDRFKAKMGFEPGVGALGDAMVRVIGDGTPLYENTHAKGTDSPIGIDVDVKGISQLTLEVDFGTGQDVGDRIVWADARVLRAKVGG